MTKTVTLAFDFNGVLEVTPPEGTWTYLEATRAVPAAFGISVPDEQWFRHHYGMKDRPWYGFVVEYLADAAGEPAAAADQAFGDWVNAFLGAHADGFASGASKWLDEYLAGEHAPLLGKVSLDPATYFFNSGGVVEFVKQDGSPVAAFLDFAELAYQANTADRYAANGLPFFNPVFTSIVDQVRAGDWDANLVIVSTENEERIQNTLDAHNASQYFSRIYGGKVNKSATLKQLADEADYVVFIDDQVNGIGHGLAAAESAPGLSIVHISTGLHDQATIAGQLGDSGYVAIDSLDQLPALVERAVQA